MMDNIRSLPFILLILLCSDRRNIAAVESYLRHGSEALLDLGRHIMA